MLASIKRGDQAPKGVDQILLKLSVGVTGHPYLLENDCLFTQGS